MYCYPKGCIVLVNVLYHVNCLPLKRIKTSGSEQKTRGQMESMNRIVIMCISESIRMNKNE